MPDIERERAIIAGIELKSRGGRPSSTPATSEQDAEESLQELRVLAHSAGADIVDEVLQSREAPVAATLLGSGKVEELAAKVKTLDAGLVIFDRDLTPTQQRNLERALDCKVIDRTQLILDIFASRARTREGQLQVELAQLNYLLPRLTGRGTQMSRLGGGIGTRGPGETQLETDRRVISKRIKRIEDALESVRSSRTIQRRQRQAVPLATVSLVGYTNAGKSTLFNRLTQAGVLSDQRMFATLDPTVRQFTLPSQRKILLSDTVGFIRNLPTTLIKAFRATLEEVTEAALLLHVVDIASAEAEQQFQHVLQVLNDIEAASTPQVLVLNKVDLLNHGDSEAQAVLDRFGATSQASSGIKHAIGISARTGQGIEDLVKEIDSVLQLDPTSRVRVCIPQADGASIHFLHENARVIERRENDEFVEVIADVPASVKRRLGGYVREFSETDSLE